MSTAATSTAGSASAAAANDKSGKHDDIAAARRFLEYVDASPTPFHAVATTSAMLDAAGFERVK